MLKLPEYGFYREDVEPALVAAGYDRAEIEAVDAWLKRTYDNEDEFEYSTEIRIAREGCAEEVAAYERTKANGCCGDHEEVIEVVRSDGATSRIMLGFTFGH